MPDLNIGFGTPFDAQIDFLRKKLGLPTERWDDIQRSAHDRAFVVAGAAKADLLNDLQASLVASAESGAGLDAWRKDFKAIVAKYGWTGWTGEDSPGGVAWRTKVIYQTNMATSYAAGRYQQLTDPEYLKLRPFWRYIHADGVLHPRPQHLAWHGLTLRYDHPFWLTHFAPNGWGCHCRIVAVSEKEGLASARAGLGEPPAGWQQINPKTGAQDGIDKGFDYTPGANVDRSLRASVQEKLITYPKAIEKALTADVNRYINATIRPAAFVQEVLKDRQRKDPLWLGFVENDVDVSKAAGVDVKGYFVTLPSDAPRHVESSHGHDGGDQRPAKPADFEHVQQVLTKADSLLPGDLGRNGNARVVAVKDIDGERFRAVFEVLTGKKNRALALLSLVIKTSK